MMDHVMVLETPVAAFATGESPGLSQNDLSVKISEHLKKVEDLILKSLSNLIKRDKSMQIPWSN
jgi:hypothetical protein